MFTFIESGTRGRLSVNSKRYAEANNPRLPEGVRELFNLLGC